MSPTKTSLVLGCFCALVAAGGCGRIEDPVKAAKIAVNDRQYDNAISHLSSAPESARNTYEVQMLFAKAYFGKRDHAKSLAAYEKAAELDSRSVEPLLGQAQVELEQARAASAEQDISRFQMRALDHCRRALAVNDKCADAYALSADIREARAEVDDAIEALQKAVQLEPANPARKLALARLYLNHGQVPKASQLISDMLAQDPAQTEARVLRALVLGRTNKEDAQKELRLALADPKLKPEQQDQARAALASIDVELGDIREAAELADQLQKSDAYRGTAYYIKGVLFLREEKWDKAYERLKPLENTRDSTRNNPELITRLAWTEEKLGRVNEATAHYQLVAEKLDPKHIGALRRLAHLMLNRQMFDESIKYCDRILKERPNDPFALRIKAVIHRTPGSRYQDYEKARVCYLKLLARERSPANTILDLAELHLDMNQPLRAIELAARAASGENRARVGVILGRAYVLMHYSGAENPADPGKSNLAEAIRYLKQAQMLEPTNPSVSHGLAAAYLADNNSKEAANVLKQYISLKPELGSSYVMLARVYETNKQLPLAIEQLEKASKVANIKDFDRAVLGRAYFLAGKRAEATDVWRRLLTGELAKAADPAVIAGLAAALALDGQNDDALRQADALALRETRGGFSALVAASVAVQADRPDKAASYLEPRSYSTRRQKESYVKFPDACRRAGANGKRAAALLSEGLLHLMFQSPDTAIPLLQQATQLLPDCIIPYYALAGATARARRLKDMVDVYQRIFTKFPSEGYPHFELAVLGGGAESVDVRQQVELALDLDPDIAAAHIMLAQHLLAEAQGDPKLSILEAALRHAEDAVRLDNESMAALETAARVHSSIAQVRRSEMLAEQDPAARQAKTTLAEQSSQKARGMLQLLSAKYPNSVEAAKERIRFELAEANFADAATLANDYVQSERWDDPDLRLLAAMALLESGKHEQAEKQLLDLIRLHPTHVAAHRHLAVAYARMQRPTWAIEALRTALRIEPGNLPATFELAAAYLRYGRPAEAREVYTGVVNTLPESRNPRVAEIRNRAVLGLVKALLDLPAKDAAEREKNLEEGANRLRPMTDPPAGEKPSEVALLLLGKIMEEQKREAKALELYQKAVEVNPRFLAGYQEAVRLHYRQARYDEAIRIYNEKVIPLARYDLTGYAQLVLVYLARGGASDAQVAAKGSEKLLEVLTRRAGTPLAVTDEQEAAYRAVRVTALVAARQFAEARAELEPGKVRALRPTEREHYIRILDGCSSDPTRRQALVAHYGAALFNQSVGEHKAAIDGLEKLVEVFPKNLYLLRQLAELYLRANDLENFAATQEKQAAAADEPGLPITAADHEKLYTDLVDTYVQRLAGSSKDALEKALRTCQRGLVKWPRSLALLNRLAAIHSARQQYADAIQAFNQIISTTNVGTEPWLSAKKELALHYHMSRETQKAADVMREIDRQIEADPLALNNSAWFHATAPQPDLAFAREKAERAKALSPANAHVRDTLGWVYHLLGWFDKADPELEYAAQELPADANVAYHYGANLASTGRLEEGLKALQQAAELDRKQSSRLIEPERCKTLIERLQRQLEGKTS